MAKPYKLPSGRWRIRWIDGDGIRQSEAFETYDLARAELRRLEVGADEDRVRRARLGSAAMTVAEGWEAFRSSRKQDPNNTERRFKARQKSHAQHYESHIKPYLADVKLYDLTPGALRQWVAKLAATSTSRPGEKNPTGRTLSAATIRKIVVTLRQIAKANDVPLVVMLAEHLKQKRRRSRPKAFQCIADVRAFLAGCRDPWFKVAAAIACYAGARLGEVASLRWRHIDTEAETITIALSWEGPLKARYEDDDEAARVVALGAELAAILASWRKVTNGGDDDHVVLVNGARPLREGYDDVAQKTRAACKRAQVTSLTFHALRSSWATIAADNGLPMSSLASALGHRDIKTTAIYLRPESSRVALDPRARIDGSVPVGHVLATKADSASAVLN